MSACFRLATLSNGEQVENPRWYRKILRELRVLQRKIARAVFGGQEPPQAGRRLQRLLAKVANSRGRTSSTSSPMS